MPVKIDLFFCLCARNSLNPAELISLKLVLGSFIKSVSILQFWLKLDPEVMALYMNTCTYCALTLLIFRESERFV